MAKKQTESCNYRNELKLLESSCPERVYFLYGPEDYLSSSFLKKLRDTCLPEGDDGFSLKRFDGPELDLNALENAVNAMPFLSDRIFIELHNVDTNKISDADRFSSVLESVPEYTTVVFYQDAFFSPDSRLKTNKALKTKGRALFFDAPSEADLLRWIRKCFSEAGQTIGEEECRRLMFVSGTRMNRLAPEIDKLSAFASGGSITLSDIDAVANRIPEADVFELVNCITSGKKEDALRLLADLLSDKKNEPIAMLALISYQLRRLYAVKLILNSGGGRREVSSFLKTNWDKLISETISQAKAFSASRLSDAIDKCATTDYLMKSSSVDDTDLLKEQVLFLLL